MKSNVLSGIKLAVFAIIAIIIDQITKYFATVNLSGNRDVILIKNVLRLHYLDGGNKGAAWGMFSGKTFLFIIFTIVAIIIIMKFVLNIQKLISNNETMAGKKSTIFLQYMLTLLMAGAFGNLLDRSIHHYVIDFIYFELIDFPIFNVADCYVTVSCIIILIICLFYLKDDLFNSIFTLKGNKLSEDDEKENAE